MTRTVHYTINGETHLFVDEVAAHPLHMLCGTELPRSGKWYSEPTSDQPVSCTACKAELARRALEHTAGES